MRDLTRKGYKYLLCDYAFYNDDKLDRELFYNIGIKNGYTDVKVYRVKTDTKGLKMYEVWVK